MAEVPAIVLRPAGPGPRPYRLGRAAVTGPLAAVVEQFWCVEWALVAGQERWQDVVTHPCAHLTVEGDRSRVQGVLVHRFRRRLAGRGRVVGARLRPAGLTALGDVPPAALVDRRVPAEEVLGDVSGLVGAVRAAPDGPAGRAAMQCWLAARDPRPPEGAALVDEAVAAAAGDPELTRVDQLAAALGVPVRTLQRRFDRHLGVGPKWVLRRCRVQDALAAIEAGHEVDWAALATRLGYADQSHFVNSFTAQVGIAPAAYARRPEVPRSKGDEGAVRL